jgi:polyisoprenoid-binding protein YceI
MSPRFAHMILVLPFIILAGCSSAANPTPEQIPAISTPIPIVDEATATSPPDSPTPEQAIVTPTDTSTSPPTAMEMEEVVTPEKTSEPAAKIRAFRLVPDASEVNYAVEEEFFNQPTNFFTAVGRTNAIEGEFQLQIEGNQVELGPNQFTVDLRTLTSDDNRRDNRIRTTWLESNSFPWAEFTATALEDFPNDAAEGQEVAFKLVGNMTIREITNPQTFEVTAKLEDDTVTGTATTFLFMNDYGFEPPSILNILKVTDGVTVTVAFMAEEVVDS